MLLDILHVILPPLPVALATLSRFRVAPFHHRVLWSHPSVCPPRIWLDDAACVYMHRQPERTHNEDTLSTPSDKPLPWETLSITSLKVQKTCPVHVVQAACACKHRQSHHVKDIFWMQRQAFSRFLCTLSHSEMNKKYFWAIWEIIVYGTV